ncbi:hypothetical protein SAMN06264364_11546 [Quadrisphaera granulorum]|uniref:Uncharacterized protein n=1 Tax=Quadrisphaera granulorum TaxID=317664 RepID=A0A316A688_9ACTN|nr:DUF6541 family protein [Quadrisphaera granulorum]PWJ53029.1 hypothetical protein BXY45_11546 [Quadrisphaera granulorum]SZE97194.1 hypothetical protein SAMN06264364_11546 [Quadrisphaera granulorum]
MVGWSAAVAPAAVAAAVLVVPGLLVGRAAGLRGLVWTGVAPALSTGVVALGAIGASLAGFRWGLLALALATALAVAVALPVGVLSGAFTTRRPSPGARRLSSRDAAVALSALGGLAGGGLLAGRRLMSALWDPTAVSQSYDAVFHLNAVRWVIDTGDGSSLHLGRLTNPGAATSFYPAAWHDVVSLAAMTSGAAVDVSTNATALVVALVVWPLGSVGLVRAVLGRRPVALAAAGALTAAFTSQPIAPLEWGVLYPTLLTNSLLPAPLALLVLTADRTRPLRRRLTLLIVVAGTLPGLALAQPSGGFALVALALPLGAAVLLRTTTAWWRSGQRIFAVVMPVLVLVVAVLAWRVVDGSASVVSARATHWEPKATLPQAVEQAVLFSHLSIPNPIRWEVTRPPLWMAAALVLFGLALAVRRRQLRWVAGSHLVASLLYVCAWAVQSPLTQRLTGYWFNDAYRVAGLTVITGLVLASAALSLGPAALRRSVRRLQQLVEGARRPARDSGRRAGPAPGRGTGRRAASGRRRAAPSLQLIPADRWAALTTMSSALAVLVVLAGARGPGYAVTYGSLFANSVASDDTQYSDVLDAPERAMLNRVPSEVPAGVMVAGNPWNGSGFVYAIADRLTPFPHMTSTFDADRALVALHLRDAATDPEVCAAVQRLHLGYVLDFGTYYLWGGDDPEAGRDRKYPGLLDLATAPGFTLVDAQGPDVKLYKIDACGAITPAPSSS